MHALTELWEEARTQDPPVLGLSTGASKREPDRNAASHRATQKACKYKHNNTLWIYKYKYTYRKIRKLNFFVFKGTVIHLSVQLSVNTFGNCKNLISSVQFSRSVVSDSLRPHESQHARPPCPSPTPGVHSDLRPSSRWCHPAISSSVVPFSSCPQSLPASESFPMSQLFSRGGQSTKSLSLVSFFQWKRRGNQIIT